MVKITLPIGAKLVIIITAVFFLSLGLIIFLVAFFVSSNIEKTALSNNKSINNMSSITVEDKLSLIRSNSLFLMENTSFNQEMRNSVPAEQIIELFFSQNPDIAVIMNRGETGNLSLFRAINERFFLLNALSEEMLNKFLETEFQALNRSLIGETIIINAAPSFNGIPLLAMSLPARDFSSVLILFSSESITDAFGTGTNSTFVVNYLGDVLVHPDQDMIRNGADMKDNPFISECIASPNVVFEKRFKNKEGYDFFGVSQKLPRENIIVVSFISADVVFEGINLTTKRNIYFSFGVWFLAVLVFWFFSKSISRPIEELKTAAERIARGDYHINLKSKSMDETGILTASVQSMSNILLNFEAFTNKHLANLAREGRLTTGGTYRNATIFFSDIRSFTAISEKLAPSEVVRFLNDYMERMVSCIILTGGTIDKFIGDAIMAHWGAVESAGSAAADALCGVRAALMMRAALRCFNKNRGGVKNPVINIGCGLNSGSVVAGQIGSDERVVFTVIGKAVSFADRAETFNKPFSTDILITGYTWNLVKDHIIAEEMSTVTEDGKQVKIFAVINMKNGEEGERLLADLKKVPKTDMEICGKCVGPKGPRNIDELRKLLGLPTPDLSGLNLDDEEKKYNVAS
ncbi:MAG: adenylate/guanylate cyclase domain-containing protein [Spirochaetaceae bacterium]|nr:adenylate/guanylate cyclase domain-containing protein [Spirochaetaceae bacterium]